MAHMRVRTNLTDEEYAKPIAFLRRLHDVPSANEPVPPSPNRFIISQPMPELRAQPPDQARPPNRRLRTEERPLAYLQHFPELPWQRSSSRVSTATREESSPL